MYAYKTAVAVKKYGYKNIKIYNGGIKDWTKSKLPIESIDPLPEHTPKYLEAGALAEILNRESSSGCVDSSGKPSLVLLDLRNEAAMGDDLSAKAIAEGSERLLSIDTPCLTISRLFDEFLDESVRNEIPREVPVVTITETGNRDDQVQAFLTKYGFNNIESLKFGMRGWLKGMYPVKNISIE